jgi:cell division septal protein FtsQ
MREKLSKIFGTLLFVVLISCLIYLSFFGKEKTNKGEIRMIDVTGNSLLSEEEYLNFTKLNDIPQYEGLTLPVIKNRFEKHPYIERADVEYAGNNKVKVVLHEKKIKAVLLDNGEPYFITDEFQVLPVLQNSKFVDLPIISNAQIEKQVVPLSTLKTEGITEAFEIIDAAKLANAEILNSLSEINLRSGGDIVLTFSGLKPPVIYGRGQAAKKMVYLDIMWQGIVEGKNLIDSSEYIDLRFANEIFVGTTEKTGLSE